jgi:DNA-binding transcriptional MerR regulator
MFAIGEFARFTRVSVKMLRHYHDIGLLPAARVDPVTGYRYYTAAQLPRLNRILTLRGLGFRLDDIAGMLAARPDLDRPGAEATGSDVAAIDDAAYDRREAELRDLLARTSAQIEDLRARRRMLAGGAATDIVLRPVGAELVATAPAGDDVAAAFCRVERHAAAHRARAARPPLMLFPPGRDPLVAVPLAWPAPPGAGIDMRRLPAVGAMACTVHRGRYGPLAGHLDRMNRWLQDTGRRRAGPVREVYLRFRAEPDLDLPPAYLTTDADELVTELQIPVAIP